MCENVELENCKDFLAEHKVGMEFTYDLDTQKFVVQIIVNDVVKRILCVSEEVFAKYLDIDNPLDRTFLDGELEILYEDDLLV